MILYKALPPELYEILNCAIAITSLIAWMICLRYLLSEYLKERNLLGILRLRLAIAMTVFLTGEWPRMAWLWIARYWGNTGRHIDWMGDVPWVFIPAIASTISVLGLACIVRAITPEAWGKWGYVVVLGTATLTVLLTQVFR
jgi:hypothetical protein